MTGLTKRNNDLAETAAVITGGASGIGRATAEAFCAAGAHVILMDINADAVVEVANELQSATALHGDISNWEDCIAAESRAKARGLPVRALVNSAATFLAKGVDATSADWDRALAVNVKGTALMASAIVPLLKASGGGAIVNVASVSAHIAQPGRWTYNATKGAIVSLTRCQALDLAAHNIRVNSISPGTIWTAELDRITGGDRDTYAPIFSEHHMLRRVGEPEEVARAILFLCTPGASFITGTDLAVDGGYLAMGHDSAATIQYEY